jgi:hypothetical protein
MQKLPKQKSLPTNPISVWAITYQLIIENLGPDRVNRHSSTPIKTKNHWMDEKKHLSVTNR